MRSTTLTSFSNRIVSSIDQDLCLWAQQAYYTFLIQQSRAELCSSILNVSRVDALFRSRQLSSIAVSKPIQLSSIQSHATPALASAFDSPTSEEDENPFDLLESYAAAITQRPSLSRNNTPTASCMSVPTHTNNDGDSPPPLPPCPPSHPPGQSARMTLIARMRAERRASGLLQQDSPYQVPLGVTRSAPELGQSADASGCVRRTTSMFSLPRYVKRRYPIDPEPDPFAGSEGFEEMGAPILFRRPAKVERPAKHAPVPDGAQRSEIKRIEVASQRQYEQPRPSLREANHKPEVKGTLASRRVGRDWKGSVLDLFPA